MFTKEQLKNIYEVKNLIKEADYIVIGAGAGLSASGGLDYLDEDLFAREYAPFLKKGYKTIWEGIGDNWKLNSFTEETFWAYWANHINFIYHKNDQLQVYKDLFNLVKDKEYFVITTNADGQFYKGGFESDKIFAMQGSYGLLQCQKPCSHEVYDNKDMIKQMLNGFDESTLKIKESDVPKCPKCGGRLSTNLRIDDTFVEKPHMVNGQKYIDFVNRGRTKKLVLLELGVGFNTPVIIRFPFEQMTKAFKDTTLVRMNKTHCEVSPEIVHESFSFNTDIGQVLSVLTKE